MAAPLRRRRGADPVWKGEASAQTHAYLLMSFAIFSLPAALLLVYVYSQLNASKARGCRSSKNTCDVKLS